MNQRNHTFMILNIFVHYQKKSQYLKQSLNITMEKMKETPDVYMDRQQWNYSSFDEGVEDAYIIHIRPKVAPGGPRRPKIENYKSLVDKGLI